MKKRKVKTTVYAMAILLVLLGGTEVLALCDSCDPPAREQIKEGYVVRLMDGYPAACSPGDSSCPEGKYEWRYQIGTNTSTPSIVGINFAAMLIPDCCTGQIFIDTANSIPTNLAVYPVGTGEDTLYFGRYLQQAYVIKGTPDSQNYWKIVTNTSEMTGTTVLLKIGKNTLTFEVAGPGCLAVPSQNLVGTIPGLNTQVIPLDDNITMVIRRGPDGCQLDQSIPASERVQFFYGGFPGGILLATLLETVPEGFIYCSGITSCPECLQGSANSPTTYSYTIGGVTYKVCYDPDNAPLYSCQ